MLELNIKRPVSYSSDSHPRVVVYSIKFNLIIKALAEIEIVLFNVERHLMAGSEMKKLIGLKLEKNETFEGIFEFTYMPYNIELNIIRSNERFELYRQELKKHPITIQIEYNLIEENTSKNGFKYFEFYAIN